MAGAARAPPCRRPDRPARRARRAPARRSRRRRDQGRAAARRRRPPRARRSPAASRRRIARCRSSIRNANKRGAVIDLHDADGWRRFCELCERADVLIENLGPAEAAPSTASSRAEVRERHPHLVHVAIADFGLDGPARRLAARGAAGASRRPGALYASGFRRPAAVLAAGLRRARLRRRSFAVVGALAGRARSRAARRGQTVEVSVQEAALDGAQSVVDPARRLRAPLSDAADASPPRNADGAYYVLPTADGYVRVLPGAPRQWRAFVELLGEPRGARRAASGSIALYRLANADVDRAARGRRASRPRRAPRCWPRRAGSTCRSCRSTRRTSSSREEQTRARGYFRRTGFPHVGDAPFAPVAVQLLARRPAVLDAAGARARRGRPAGFAPRAAASRRRRRAAVRCWRAPRRRPRRRRGRTRRSAGCSPSSAPRSSRSSRARTSTSSAGSRSSRTRRTARGPSTTSPAASESVCLDLRTPRGRELALGLCAAADVVIENNRGGVVRAPGASTTTTCAGCGPTSSTSRRRASGAAGRSARRRRSARSTRPSPASTGSGTTPTRRIPAGVVAEPSRPHRGASSPAVAVLAALEHRRRTGEGQLIEMAQTEAAAYLIGEVYLEGPCTGRPAQPRGNAVAVRRARTASTRAPARTAGSRSPSSATTRGSASARAVGWADEAALRDARGPPRGARRARRARRRVDARADPRRGRRQRCRPPASRRCRCRTATTIRADPHLAARGAHRHRRASRDRPRAAHRQPDPRRAARRSRRRRPAPLPRRSTRRTVLTRVLGLDARRGGGARRGRRLPVSGSIRDRAAIVGIGQTRVREEPRPLRVRHGDRGDPRRLRRRRHLAARRSTASSATTWRRPTRRTSSPRSATRCSAASRARAWGGGGSASVLVLAATAIAAGMASTVLVYRSRARGKQSAYGRGQAPGRPLLGAARRPSCPG